MPRLEKRLRRHFSRREEIDFLLGRPPVGLRRKVAKLLVVRLRRNAGTEASPTVFLAASSDEMIH